MSKATPPTGPQANAGEPGASSASQPMDARDAEQSSITLDPRPGPSVGGDSEPTVGISGDSEPTVGIGGDSEPTVGIGGDVDAGPSEATSPATHASAPKPVAAASSAPTAAETPSAQRDAAASPETLQVAAMQPSASGLPPFVGNYRILSVLGRGGMGQVYAAKHKLLGRAAAIKVLLPQYSQQPDVVNRFFNEARAAASAKNPGIVEIYDFGYQDDGSAFIAMEFLDGEDLETRLQRVGRIPLAQALLFAKQIASALSAAHDSGIVHRDLKPANIFIFSDPQVVGGERIKILDFGIAKVTMVENQAAVGGDSSQTRAGSVMGTPSYMAPEQCRGADQVDARADLYSLGCIVFEMLCGRPPFVGKSSVEVMSGHLRDDPPVPSEVEPGLGPDLDALIGALLAKDPNLRFQRASDLETALHMLLSGSPDGVVVPLGVPRELAPSTPWYHRPLVLGALLVSLAGGGAALALVQRGDDSAPRGPDAKQPVLQPIDAAPAIKPPPTPPQFFAANPDGSAPTDAKAARAGGERISWCLESDPAGAQVRYQDRVVGNTPLWVVIDRDPERSERFAVEQFGYVEAYVDMVADHNRTRLVELQEQVKLTIRSHPSGAIIYDAEGRARGPTPGVILAPPGDQPLAFVLRHDGYADEPLEITPDEAKTVRAKLTPVVSLRIESEPAGAEVWLDDAQVGVTPYQEQVKKSGDTRRYRLQLSGYREHAVPFKARRDHTAQVTLEPSP